MHKEDLAKTYNKYKLVLFPLMVIISAIVLGYFVFYPQIEKLMANQDKISNINKKIQILEKKAQQLENLDENDLKDKLEVALRSLPAEADFANVLAIVQNLAAENQFEIVNFQTGNPGEGASQKVAEYSVNLDLKGPAEFAKGFIDSLNGSFRMMRTSSIGISVSSTENNITSAVTLNIYYSAIPTSIGGVDTPINELSKEDEDLIGDLTNLQPVFATQEAPTGPRGKTNPFE